MEGAGGRLGRSSTRYGAMGASTSVFTGPVRKWKKKWVPIPPQKAPRGQAKSNAGNTLLLFKWTQASDGGEEGGEEGKEEPPRRKFRYIPIAKLNEKKTKVDENAAKAKFKKAASVEKPDMNDVPMYEVQGRGGKVARQDLNVGTFDLSLE